MIFSVKLATIFAVLLRSRLEVSALPFSQVAALLPRDITHIALDERTNEYIAFKRDGTLHARYPAGQPEVHALQLRDTTGTCTNLSTTEAQTLPGWNQIVQYAKTNWGSGSYNLATNPPDYPTYPALVCINGQTQLSFTGTPQCQNTTNAVSGGVKGTNGSVQMTETTGFTATSTFTVESASTLGISSTLEATVGVPDIDEVKASFTMSAEITNTNTQSYSPSYSSTQSTSVTFDSNDGQTCNVSQGMQTCTLQATGKIQYLASGFVWFNYNSQTNGHYKWAASIDTVLTNTADRSSYATIQGSVESKTLSEYGGNCAKA